MGAREAVKPGRIYDSDEVQTMDMCFLWSGCHKRDPTEPFTSNTACSIAGMSRRDGLPSQHRTATCRCDQWIVPCWFDCHCAATRGLQRVQQEAWCDTNTRHYAWLLKRRLLIHDMFIHAPSPRNRVSPRAYDCCRPCAHTMRAMMCF